MYQTPPPLLSLEIGQFSSKEPTETCQITTDQGRNIWTRCGSPHTLLPACKNKECGDILTPILMKMGISPQSTFYNPVLLIQITSVYVLSYCATLSDTLGHNKWSELQHIQPDLDGLWTYLCHQARLFIQAPKECRDTNVILHPFERLTA